MPGFSPYAAGSKVYRGGSSFAHRGGGLDPMGYINRELNKGMGGKPSNQRSGHAAAAMSKLASKGFGQGGPAGVITKVPTADQSYYESLRRQQQSQIPQGDGETGPNHPSTSGSTSGYDSGTSGAGTPNAASVAAPVISTTTGKLTLNPELMQDQNQIDFEFNSGINDIEAQRTSVQAQYDQGNRDLQTQQQQDQRGDVNRFAARGMAFSSGYGNEVSESATMFQRAFADLLTGKNNSISALDAQKGSLVSWKDVALRNLMERQRAINAANAGSLGLDPNFVPPGREEAPEPQQQEKYSTGARAKNNSKKKKKRRRSRMPGSVTADQAYYESLRRRG